MATYSVYDIKIDNSYTMGVTTATVSSTYTQSLASGHTYVYNLSGNTTFGFSNATTANYNFLINAGTFSFSLSSGSNWKTVSATALGFTGSFAMSGIYDGTDMWVSTVKNYLSY